MSYVVSVAVVILYLTSGTSFSQTKVDKLDRVLTDYMQRYQSLEEGEVKVSGGIEGVSKKKVRVHM